MIIVQENDFSISQAHSSLKKTGLVGAITTFTGTVREFSQKKNDTFFLQHYPGMTEKVLNAIEIQALKRWNLINTLIIHRVGHLKVDDNIVFVGASSAHRDHAFEAAKFMIDVLKTDAPFWKKEGHNWVKSKSSDADLSRAWKKSDT